MSKSQSRRKPRLTIDGYTFSPGELEWARDNLPKMRRMTHDSSVLYLIMTMTFIFGLIVYFAADGISTGALVLPAGWRVDLIADFLYNLGVVLWTSVVLVFFMEVVVDYQRRRWQRYVQLIERTLKIQGVPIETEAAPELDWSAKLNVVIERLAALDRLQAEVAELKARLPDRSTAA